MKERRWRVRKEAHHFWGVYYLTPYNGRWIRWGGFSTHEYALGVALRNAGLER